MSYKVLSKCPICDSNLKVERLKCEECGTVIENKFQLSKFEYLSREQLLFIEIFIKCRGNIKDVEKELGISYPTVRAKLDEVIEELGYNIEKKPKVKNKEVLDMLEEGKISPEEAIRVLKNK